MPRRIDIPQDFQEEKEESVKKSDAPLSVKQARSIAQGYISELRLANQYQEDEPQMREALFDLIKRLIAQERQIGGPTDFHNLAANLGRTGYDSLACDVLEKGLSLFPSDVDLLADYLIYGIDCERMDRCKEIFEQLTSLPKGEWTWRAFSFSIAYLRRMQSILAVSEEREAAKKKMAEIVRSYKKYLPWDEAAYREYARLFERQPGKELALLEEALENSSIGACPSCAFRCADILFDQKRYEEALSAIQRSLEDAMNQRQGGIDEYYLRFLEGLCKLAMLMKKTEYEEQEVIDIYSNFNIAVMGISSEYAEKIRTRVRILEQETGIHVPDSLERLQEVIGY